MFAAESDREFLIVEQPGFGRKNFRKHFIKRSAHRVDCGERVNTDPLVSFQTEFLVIELHIAARFEDGRGAVARAVLVRGGTFERYGENHRAGFV